MATLYVRLVLLMFGLIGLIVAFVGFAGVVNLTPQPWHVPLWQVMWGSCAASGLGAMSNSLGSK